jgi:glyoxylase-like metal-dependent hydrolase (beta-lactamase superfamily II)
MAPGRRKVVRALALVGLLAVAVTAPLVVRAAARRTANRPRATAPGDIYTTALLHRIRRASAMVPGDAPTRVSVQVLSVFDIAAADADEGAAADTVQAVRAAYQIRYPTSWIMVDAGILYDVDYEPVRAAYDTLQQALLAARLIVFTHEHQDHLGGVVRSPHRAELERNTLFTRSQLDWLGRQLPGSLIPVSPEEAARFISFDYDPLVAIAPGVVLVKAPGHTHGSQIVYVRLASGEEVILSGDIAYMATALWAGRQKPDNPDLDEDRDAIDAEMTWFRSLASHGIEVVVSHDYAQLEELVARGVLHLGLELGPVVEQR